MRSVVSGVLREEYAWRGAVAAVVLLLDVALTMGIVAKVPYTEIDWVAYMQEVGGVISGERDYSLLKGNTGPLVYPAGFVWFYAGLHWICEDGRDVALAQMIFAGIYLLNQGLVLALYKKAGLSPAWALPLLMLSKRVHSIFVLRMFNDSVAMLLLHAAMLLFTSRKWTLGCVIYSLAVSVKMNILLFAPSLLFLLLCAKGLSGAVQRIALCALLQVLVALPFLAEHPIAYIRGSFDLGRVFMHRWSVNLKYLPEEVFVSRALALALLGLHLAGLALFFVRHLKPRAVGIRVWSGVDDLTPAFVCVVMYAGNFIGIVFVRSLHFQFYAWYFHSLPALLWATRLPTWSKLSLFCAIEVAFNLTDATGCGDLPRGPDCGSPTSRGAALLTISHLTILAALLLAPSLSQPSEKTGPHRDITGPPQDKTKRS